MEHPLLARYLAGECSAAETEDVQHWIAASSENRRVFEQFEAVWHSTRPETAWDVEAALAKAEQALQERPPLALVGSVSERDHVRVALPSRRRLALAIRVAAALVLLVGGAIAVGVVPMHRSAVVAHALMRTATTPRGQRASFQLADGTGVMLGPGSTLRYPRAFSGKAREVELVGEAYFEVQHNAQHPFIVRAGNLTAIDLGTEFTVTAYPDDAGARVAVRAGLVGLRASPHGVERVLRPGDLGRVGPRGELTVGRADTAAQFAWTRGELVLPGIPLRDAAPQIARWYDVEVRLASPEIGALRLEASFEREPVADVFRLIAATHGLRVERTGSIYTLRAQ